MRRIDGADGFSEFSVPVGALKLRKALRHPLGLQPRMGPISVVRRLNKPLLGRMTVSATLYQIFTYSYRKIYYGPC